MTRRIFYFLASILMIALLFLILDTDKPGTDESISILSTEIITNKGMRFVEPELKNNSDQSYTNVRIDVLLFDSNNKVLDKFSIETKEIPAGQIWSPSIPTEHNTASHFEILKIHSDQEVIEK